MSELEIINEKKLYEHLHNLEAKNIELQSKVDQLKYELRSEHINTKMEIFMWLIFATIIQIIFIIIIMK